MGTQHLRSEQSFCILIIIEGISAQNDICDGSANNTHWKRLLQDRKITKLEQETYHLKRMTGTIT